VFVFVVGGYAPLDGPPSILYALLLLVRVVDVVLLREQVSFDLRILQQLEVSFCNRFVSPLQCIPNPNGGSYVLLDIASHAQLQFHI
jgi:hypothetical protein